MIVHNRQAWWCHIVNDPFFPEWREGESGATWWFCPLCGMDNLDFPDGWPEHSVRASITLWGVTVPTGVKVLHDME